LHDRNVVLLFDVLADHLAELLPIACDPTVGDAIKKWSRDYRQSSNDVYLSVDRRLDVKTSLAGLGLGPDDVNLIVVSDAQEIPMSPARGDLAQPERRRVMD
jgi:malate dehydrogenase (oxaloacetate-decarboxylating)